ncbi:MAG: adenylate/guanylate cyclase domain-containing protein [Actinomycetota bacterium]
MPETRYAKGDGGYLAYQVVGTGPDLVFLPEWLSHVEAQWEEPRIARFLTRLASFTRLILFNRRGTGLSDPVAPNDLPTIEQWMTDVRVVMDAAAVERGVLWGLAGGGPMAALFAATFPARTSGLVLTNTFARLTWAPDHTIGTPIDNVARLVAEVEASWGSADTSLRWVAPSLATDERARSWMARYERLSAGPSAAAAIIRMLYGIDIRHVLSAIRVPTLIIHRTGARVIPVEHGRDLARRIPHARYLELPGDDVLYWAGDSTALIDEVQEFLTGHRAAATDERFLATLLFVDIVESTQRLSSMGDRRWKDFLDTHEALLDEIVHRYGGRVVDTAGDGLLAAFDGPARAIRSACAIVRAARESGVEVRAGLHTGEVESRGERVAGLAVHIAARVAAAAGRSEVLVSRTVKDLIAGSGIDLEAWGEHVLRGIPERWQLYRVALENTC